MQIREPNPTYPLSVQAHSFAGKVVYGVYSAYIHDFLANMDNYPTYAEAESVMHEYIAKTKEYGK